MEHGGDERVRSRAYELWEKEGRPEGKDKEHWSRAERELLARQGNKPAASAKRDSEDGSIVGMAAEVPIVRRKRTASGSATGAANVASSLPAATSGRGDKPLAGATKRGKNG